MFIPDRITQARLPEEHLAALSAAVHVLNALLCDGSKGLNEDIDAETSSVVAFLALELHQTLLAVEKVAIQIPPELRDDVMRTLGIAHLELTLLRDVLRVQNTLFPSWFTNYHTFAEAHPLPAA
jgi:hypothetical protein